MRALFVVPLLHFSAVQQTTYSPIFDYTKVLPVLPLPTLLQFPKGPRSYPDPYPQPLLLGPPHIIRDARVPQVPQRQRGDDGARHPAHLRPARQDRHGKHRRGGEHQNRRGQRVHCSPILLTLPLPRTLVPQSLTHDLSPTPGMSKPKAPSSPKATPRSAANSWRNRFVDLF